MYNRLITTDWDFRSSDTKEYTHCYHTYPAMMIPQIARKLIKDFAPASTKLIFDPYMGSGTTLVESAIAGIDCIGTDINPLARFISRVKTNQYSLSCIDKYYSNILTTIESFDESNLAYSFEDFKHITNPDFWYSLLNLNKLQVLTNEIKKIPTKEKTFFQLILSEIIREASYTRNGEFKRYRIAKDKLDNFNVDPFSLFQSKSSRNIEGLKSFLEIKGKGCVVISDFNTVNGINKSIFKNKEVDMILTSPPYGDSRTTVAYGQFSRWANEWFLFDNAKNLDSHLMGGDLKVKRPLLGVFNSVKSELEKIKNADSTRFQEVEAFLEDYRSSMENVANLVRNGGVVCYVVGNRTVKGVQISLDYFTAEVFERYGFSHLNTFVREIPNKRMPIKTSPTNIKGASISTMNNEYIVILKKDRVI